MSDDMIPVDRHDHVVEVNDPGNRVRKRVVRDYGAERTLQIDRAVQVVWLALGALEFLLGLRAVLKLIAANPANPFANFIYNITQVFLWPFSGLTVTPAANGMVLEIPTLIAMAVYALLGWLFIRLIWLVFDKPTARSVSSYEEYD
jgi:hypothetical protein